MISARVRRSPAFDGSSASRVFKSPSSTSFVRVVSKYSGESAEEGRPHNLLDLFYIVVAIVVEVVFIFIVFLTSGDGKCGLVVKIIVFIVFGYSEFFLLYSSEFEDSF